VEAAAEAEEGPGVLREPQGNGASEKPDRRAPRQETGNRFLRDPVAPDRGRDRQRDRGEPPPRAAPQGVSAFTLMSWAGIAA